MREIRVAEQRYQAVLAVISDGLSISQVDIGRVLAAERFVNEVLVMVAAYVAFALIIAVAIR
jgi:hypothetical protein